MLPAEFSIPESTSQAGSARKRVPSLTFLRAGMHSGETTIVPSGVPAMIRSMRAGSSCSFR
jgi:hypothetical protein